VRKVIAPDANQQNAWLLQHDIVKHLATAQECHPAVRSHHNDEPMSVEQQVLKRNEKKESKYETWQLSSTETI
jgi:hypothetical protein